MPRPSTRPPPPRPAPPPRRRGTRWLLTLSLAVSAAVHAVVLGVRVEIAAPGGSAAAPRRSLPPAQQMRVYDISLAAGDDAPLRARALERPRRELSPEAAATRPAPDASAAQPIDAADTNAGRLPATLRLGPRNADPRLWQRSAAAAPERIDAVHERVREQVTAINDSIAAARARAAARTAAQWTTQSGSDGRLGLTLGHVHLGRTTIPYCIGSLDPRSCGFGIAPGRREEYDERLRNFHEIQQQRLRAEGDRAVRDRIAAVRARADRQRDSVPES